jgi:hypothetical protein
VTGGAFLLLLEAAARADQARQQARMTSVSMRRRLPATSSGIPKD